jgi:hypothetical protein
VQKGNQLLILHKDFLMPDEVLYAFNDADSLELLRIIGSGSSTGGNSDPTQQTADCLIAVATSTITARAGTTLGTGTAKVKRITDANVLEDLYDVNVVNMGSAIANGAYLKLFRIGNKFSAVEIC